MNRNLFLLLQGQFVSQIGTQLAQIATIFWLTTATGSPAIVGVFMAACAFPPLLLAPLGGVCVDIFPKKLIIVLCDVVSGAAVLGLAYASQASFQHSEWFIFAVFAVNILLASLNAFFLPGIGALIPQLAGGSKMHLAVSWSQTINMASVVTGQALAGILLGWRSPRFLYVLDGLSYLFTAAMESGIHVSQEQISEKQIAEQHVCEEQKDTLATEAPRVGLFRASTEGWSYIRQRPELRHLFIAAVPLNVLLSPLWVLMPFYTTSVLGKTENWYGYFLASFCIGLLSGYLVPSVLRSAIRNAAGIMVISVLAIPMLMVGLSLLQSAYYTLVALVLMGLAAGLVSVFGVVVLQKLTGPEAQGRVMGLLVMVTQGVGPLVGSAAGLFTGRTAVHIRMLYAVCGLLMFFFGADFLRRKDSRDMFRRLGENAAG